ncbi:dipeptidase 1 [Tribolium castaneum]|uniref:dipeptidase 1 n=1 Tax=Tribolium castaneum TaxID=7070 RepID=UPI00077DA4FF|nr:PREDICTED: dipeptidase 1 [Tribolium castaneum]|eukprot:XP_008193877.2 PREDICTED: dipeptidase 1 [Tribolium castaneum]
MKSSKYTQASTPNDNDYRDYQNVGLDDGNQNVNPGHRSSDYLLHSYQPPDRFSPNANRFPVDIELCNCAKEAVFKAQVNRSFSTLPKFESTNLSQYSLDRKVAKFAPRHKFQCERPRIQSPEIINIHRGPNNVLYDGYGDENCAIKSCAYDKEFKCDDYGFRRGHPFRTSARSNVSHGHPKRRPADGMDAEMDDPELMFELTEHLGDCQCACDHVVYSPSYTTCLQEDRVFAPAPDVTRRMGSPKVVGKPEPPGSPPYYRSTSATSSSSNSASSRIELSSRHWWIIVTVLLLAAAAGVGVPIALKISSSASFEERLEFATRLLQEVPLIDGHNDLPWNIRKFLHNKLKNFKFNEDLRNVSPWSTSAWSHTDLVRLEAGHVAAQFWAAYVPCDSQYKDAVQLTLEQIDVIRRFTELYHPRLTLCTSSEDIKSAYKRHQLCSLIGVEGGHSLAGSLAVLRTLYHVGVRYLTLTSTCNTPWADCSYADMPGKKPEHGGLTSFGKSVVKEMNRLGMIVDLSHVSVRTMWDALEVSKAPVIFSHSSAHALCNSTRNVPDATLRKLALNKGVVMVNFYTQFLTCKDVATVADAVAHINHIREVAGVDNVGLGAGYDGINYVPQGLEDVSSYPTLFAELIGTGKWSVEDLKKLAGLNFLRVLQDVEKIRDEFKKANIPPYEDVLLPRPKSNCSSQD